MRYIEVLGNNALYKSTTHSLHRTPAPPKKNYNHEHLSFVKVSIGVIELRSREFRDKVWVVRVLIKIISVRVGVFFLGQTFAMVVFGGRCLEI